MSIPAEKIKTFLEVASAIRTIRDQRVYREEFDSFNAYCLTKLGLSEEVVSRLLDEAALETELRRGKLFSGSRAVHSGHASWRAQEKQGSTVS